MSERRVRNLRIAAAVAALWLAAVLTPGFVFRIPEARAFFVNRALAAISDGMRGDMEVGTVDELSLQTWTVGARDFRVRDELGVQVLHVDHAAITIDPWSLLSGEVRITRARGVNGQLEVTERADGEIGIDRAFQGTNDGGSFSLSPVVRFDRIDAENVRVHVSAPGADLVGHRVHGEVGLVAGSSVSTYVSLHHVRGHVRLSEPMVVDLPILAVNGHLDTSSSRRFDAQVRARFMGDPLVGRVGIVREGDHSRFVVEADGEGLFGDIADALVDVLAGL